MTGFYSPATWTKQKQPLTLVPQCGLCGLYKHCKSPKMKVTGQGKKKVLIVAEAPGQHEDEKGIQLVGNAGQELIRILANIGINMRKDCWLTNAITCQPTEDGGNRKPTPEEIDYCRPNLVNTLEELKPNVVISLGDTAIRSIIALAWKDGEVKDVGQWVGWRIPSIKLNTWICPSYHPSYLLREKSQALELHTTKHLKKAFCYTARPWKEPPDYTKRVKCFVNADDAIPHLKMFLVSGLPIAFDFETNCLKPDRKDSRILCCAVSDGEISIAFPWHGKAIETMKQILQSDIGKIAANLRFEERWVRRHLGISVKNWVFDTVIGSHWADCRHGINSLKFQSFVRLGVSDYDSHLQPYMEGDGGNGLNILDQVELPELLKYCGMDAILEVKVAKVIANSLGVMI
jgi:uracil-DNA glycosylase